MTIHLKDMLSIINNQRKKNHKAGVEVDHDNSVNSLDFLENIIRNISWIGAHRPGSRVGEHHGCYKGAMKNLLLCQNAHQV